jgi:hypothetical protein
MEMTGQSGLSASAEHIRADITVTVCLTRQGRECIFAAIRS